MEIDNPLADIALENLEVVIDTMISNEVVREIPFLSTVVGLLKGAKNIRDRLFAQKLEKFITELTSIDEKAKQKLFEKIASDPEEAKRVGETTVLLLERATDIEKADIIAKMFLAYGLEHLTSSEFRRMCEAIDRAFIDDLNEFLNLHKISDKTQDVFMASLVPSGFTAVVGADDLGDIGQIFYQITTLGNKFRNAYFNGRKYIVQQTE